jgi:copper chaperone CopZ
MKVALLLPFALGLLVACQRADDPQPPPETTRIAQVEAVALSAVPAETVSCGGACGGSCGGSCGGGGGAGGADVPAAPVPADAVWTELQVSGMHCGGCARRVRNALAHVEGVYGVEVDLGSQVVKIAVAPGHDGRALAAPRIDALGYRVVTR